MFSDHKTIKHISKIIQNITIFSTLKTPTNLQDWRLVLGLTRVGGRPWRWLLRTVVAQGARRGANGGPGALLLMCKDLADSTDASIIVGHFGHFFTE